MLNRPNERVMKIMRSYHPANPEEISKEDFEYAKAQGFMFDRVQVDHDQAVAESFDAFINCNKSEVSDNFLVGLSRAEPELRAALSAYAIMTTFPKHGFIQNASLNCADCAMMREESVDLSFINIARYFIGGVLNRKPYTLAFCLQAHQKTQKKQPSFDDINIFIDVLDVVADSPSNETPSSLYKKIRKISGIKLSVEQARHFIDTLGYAGILDTKRHQGFIFKYATHLAPRKSHSSDWAYPVDFWTGADGVNLEGVNYWFGRHPQIATWIDSKRNASS